MVKMFSSLMIAVLVTGCASPKFFGMPAVEVSVDESRFRVFTQPSGHSVEVHRISIEPLPSLVGVLERAYRAIEMVTGCPVVAGSLRGDQAIILAEVDCGLS